MSVYEIKIRVFKGTFKKNIDLSHDPDRVLFHFFIVKKIITAIHPILKGNLEKTKRIEFNRIRRKKPNCEFPPN